VESKLSGCFQLFPQGVETDDIAKAYRRGAIQQCKRRVGRGKVLPNKLQHKQFVKISVEKGAGNGVQFPVVIVRASGEINNHDESTLIECPVRLEATSS
jgi:hypothetical protein